MICICVFFFDISDTCFSFFLFSLWVEFECVHVIFGQFASNTTDQMNFLYFNTSILNTYIFTSRAFHTGVSCVCVFDVLCTSERHRCVFFRSYACSHELRMSWNHWCVLCGIVKERNILKHMESLLIVTVNNECKIGEFYV